MKLNRVPAILDSKNDDLWHLMEIAEGSPDSFSAVQIYAILMFQIVFYSIVI